jgi:hypothetical protein
MAVDVLAGPQVLLPASRDDIGCLTMDSEGMALFPRNLLSRTLRGAGRVATKAADLTLSRPAAAISPAALISVEWLRLWVAERTVVVFEHLNPSADTVRTGPPVNHDRSRPAECAEPTCR